MLAGLALLRLSVWFVGAATRFSTIRGWLTFLQTVRASAFSAAASTNHIHQL